ncbi:MAG TPA: RNA polymerase-associated protein RapA, partial [Oceanospirillales bacterium]|nr:RNA polymerase-associated protein RapA [Oceanospirillales bacterium]
AKRVLIVIPESLTHQWMVEMLRRFNLHFSVYNELQCQAIEESSQFATPFESSQLAIVPLSFLLNNPARGEQVLATPWDLLVVDEAHHLHWSEEKASAEYQLVESLAKKIPGVLLLTATPEQLGKKSHFARLRLLDSNRFNDFAEFEAQEQNYQSIVNAIDYLRSEKPLTKVGAKNTAKVFTDEADLELVQSLFEQKYEEQEKWGIKQQLIEKLLDQHGTGRLLFRNTRSAIKGFPKRKLYYTAMENCYDDYSQHPIDLQLTPERVDNFDNWTRFDMRMNWLAEKILTLVGHKILLIARNKQTILEMAETLRVKLGVHSAIFHEDLSLIERDKAAAWFADFDKGAQIMLCSEIGSEGRNFQFAHHLILFDLPFNPDLLEQRIGRLDRIGQEEVIKIHVPFFENTASEKLFRWYHEGLNLFHKTNPAAYTIFKQQKEQLLEFLSQNNASSINKELEGKEESKEQADIAVENKIEQDANIETKKTPFDEFIKQTQELSKTINQDFQKGRDKLLEYNSCRPFIAEQILNQAIASDDSSCQRFMHRMFDRYGVDYEEIRRNIEVVKPGESLKTHFPHLIEDGMSVTFERETALSNETLHFLTWEHPMVVEALDMIT